MEWDYFCEVSLSELNSDSKEELCTQLANCSVDPDASEQELKSVLELAKSLLLFKGGQIEEIKNESAAKIEQLRLESEELENQLSSSKRTRKASEAARLQKENKNLLMELEILRKKHKGKDPMLDSEEDDYRAEREKQKMKKTVELQTEHIGNLLSDLESAEAENSNLKQHLSNLRDKLAEATEALAETAADLSNSQKVGVELKNRYSEAQDEIESLRRQISELVDQRALLDSQLHQFQQAMESRVETCKVMMDQKDAEIIELKQQLMFSRPEQYTHLQETVSALTQSLSIRDQQVSELTSRLAEATKDLEESTEALEKLRNNKGDGESRKLWQQLQKALGRERALEARVDDAEKDALGRAEQVTELSTQLQKVEKGEFGLPEALAEARELRRSVGVRDADIARLVKTINHLQTSLDQLADQNLALRERFGVTEEEIDVSGVKERRANERQIIESLLMQVANLEQEKVTLKLQVREIKKGKAIVVDEVDSEVKESESADMKLLIEENESLRKGMHEILESIRSQDACSEVQVESECLERLLEALDARHLSGWYHPAMRLQAQLHNAQGVAAELRQQLRIAREQEKAWKDQPVQQVVERSVEVYSPYPIRRKFSKTVARKPVDPEWSDKVRSMRDEMTQMFAKLSRSMPLFGTFELEQQQNLADKICDLETSLEEYKSHLENQQEHSVAVCAAKCATQRIAERFALRKCLSLGAAKKRLTSQMESNSMEAIQREAKLSLEISLLKSREVNLKSEVSKLENLLSSCVPQEEFQDTQQQLQKASESLRKALLDTNKTIDEGRETSKLNDDTANYKTQIAGLLEELQNEKSKLRVLETQSHFPDAEQQVIALGQKLGALEVRESTAIKRAEHAEKMYKLAKEQVIELESEKRELEESLLSNLSVSESELPVVAEKAPFQINSDLGKIEGLESSLSAAQRQIESLQNVLNTRNLEIDALQELTQRLQSSGDLQATLGCLTEDILALRLEGERFKFKIQDNERANILQQSKLEKAEKELRELTREKVKISIDVHQREKIWKQKLVSLCSRHTACVPLSTFSILAERLRSARENADDCQKRSTELKTKLEQAELQLETTQLEDSAAKELLEILKSDSRDEQKQKIQEWHSRILQLRIKDLETSRKSSNLEKECEELKTQISNLNNYLRNLEDERLDTERNLAHRLISLEMEQCTDIDLHPQKVEKEEPLSVEELDGAEPEKPKKPKPLVRSATRTLLYESPELLKKELENKERRIMHLEKLLDGQQGDSRAKLALEAMVASLSELVALKESAVVRARNRLKEANDEGAEAVNEMRRQIIDLQNSLAKLQGAQVNEQGTLETSPGPTVTRLLTQVHTLEDELRVSNHSAAALAGQLRTINGEVQRWKDLAEARQSKLQALQSTFEEEINQAIATKLSISRVSEKAEIEMSEKDMVSVRSNSELVRAQEEAENLREQVFQMKEQIKKLRAKLSEKKSPKQKSDTPDTPAKVAEKPVVQPRFDNSKATAIISKLQAQVKNLQEEIECFKSKEQLYLDQNKVKTNEVVSRWEERKRLQGKCTRLKAKLDESEAALNKQKESNLALRTLIERLEREKILLDHQLRRKTKQPTTPQKSTPADVQLARTRTKLAAVEEECASARRQLEHYKRVAEDVPRLRAEVANLRAKVENQREVALQSQSKVARLEAANLELSLKIDYLQSTSRIEDKSDNSSDDSMSKEELQKSVVILGQHVRKLQEKLRAARSPAFNSSGDSLGRETSQTLEKADTRRRLSLENEIVQLRRERSELCAQLNQKVKILVEVRAALQEASLREAALKSEIASLRRSVHK